MRPVLNLPPIAPIAILAWTMLLLPALGVPEQFMLQDTFKSALLAFGVLITALLFFWQQRQRSAPLLWHGLVWLPLGLMLYALGSMAWSHTYLAGVEAVRWFLLSLLLWLGLNTLRRDLLPTLAWGVHIGAVVACVWAVLQFWFDFGLFMQGPQPAATFFNRNFFAEYAVCALPFSVWLLVSLPRPRWLALMAFSVALEVLAIMMTGTRSALMTLLVLAMVFGVVVFKYRNQLSFWHLTPVQRALAALVLIVGVGAMGAVPSSNPQVLREKNGITALERSFLRTTSMLTRKEYTEGSFSIRSTLWKATARMLLANPLMGVGAGAWEVQIPLYQRKDTVLEVDYYAHNEFLQLLSEYGLLGGLVLAVLWAYLLKAAGSTWRLRGADRREGPLRAFTLASLLALMIVSNAGFPWHLAGCGALLALGLGILASSDARLSQQEPFYATTLRWHPAYARAALLMLAVCIGLAAYVTQQAAQVESKIIHALQLSVAMAKSSTTDAAASAATKAQLLQYLREGIAINPHYRKLTAVAAEPLSASGDWANTVWLLESVVASRPHVAGLWVGLANGYSFLGQHERAQEALRQVQRLKPEAISTRTLDVMLLNRAGHEDQALRKLTDFFDQDVYDYDMVETGFALGYKTRNWPLAIRALALRLQTWPATAADAYFKLGHIYADTEAHDDAKALLAFRAGLQAMLPEKQASYRAQVPEKYRGDL